MDEVINCIKSLIVINFIFDAAIFIVIFLILCFLHDITGSKSENNPEVKKETVYAIKCIGRKPTECKEEWFTINQEYVVRNGQVFDDIEVEDTCEDKCKKTNYSDYTRKMCIEQNCREE